MVCYDSCRMYIYEGNGPAVSVPSQMRRCNTRRVPWRPLPPFPDGKALKNLLGNFRASPWLWRTACLDKWTGTGSFRDVRGHPKYINIVPRRMGHSSPMQRNCTAAPPTIRGLVLCSAWWSPVLLEFVSFVLAGALGAALSICRALCGPLVCKAGR